MEMETYTRSQLAIRNGTDREEMWIAYKGIIYDVAPSRHWRKGIHYGHWAGQDLTEEIGKAVDEANRLDIELKEIDGSVGQFQRNVWASRKGNFPIEMAGIRKGHPS